MSKIEVNLDWQQDQIAMAIVAEATCRLVEKFEAAIRSDVQSRVALIIEEKINAIVEDALTKVFTPVDEFGDPQGSPTSVKAILARKARTFLEEKVDTYGKAATSSHGTRMPRAEYVLGKLFEEALGHAAKKEVAAIAAQAKEKVHLEVARLIVAQIQKG